MTLRALAIVPEHNSKGKKDVTGAFLPEALHWLDTWGVSHDHLRTFDNTQGKATRREQVHASILASGYKQPIEHIAFFCHGLKDSIQTGHTCRTWGVHTTRTLADLVLIFGVCCAPDLRVTLYCCDTAREAGRAKGQGGDGGFADTLRDLMSAHGFAGGWVDGHTVTAHTTKAPFVRRFYTDGNRFGPYGGNGGDWIVAPRSPLWKPWARALQSGSLRWRYPRMTIAQIHDELTT